MVRPLLGAGRNADCNPGDSLEARGDTIDDGLRAEGCRLLRALDDSRIRLTLLPRFKQEADSTQGFVVADGVHVQRPQSPVATKVPGNEEAPAPVHYRLKE